MKKKKLDFYKQYRWLISHSSGFRQNKKRQKKKLSDATDNGEERKRGKEKRKKMCHFKKEDVKGVGEKCSRKGYFCFFFKKKSF